MSHVSLEQSVKIVVFELGDRRFGLRIEDVDEIVRAVAITPLPGVTGIVEGVINRRGRLVPVLDLRRRLGAESRPVHVDEHFLIARAAGKLVAFRAEPRTRLESVSAADIDLGAGVVPGARYIDGVARTRDGLVLIHNLRTFLSAVESDALDEALAAAGRGEDAA
jgi:purine-binding chemotaxis protein CheW